MAVRVEYKASVERDLRQLGSSQRLRILSKLERLLNEGERGASALEGAFKGLFRIRVGDYRAIYARTTRGFLVLRIAHRKESYR